MEYVGENIWAGELGRFAVVLSLTSALLAAFSFWMAEKKKSWAPIGKASFSVHAFSVFAVVGTLFYMMANHFFEYDYVWKHTSLSLPPRYLFSAFWEGQEGSFLLWMFWHAVLGMILLFTAKKWTGPVVGTIAVVQAFLSSMILGIYVFGAKIGMSPFILVREMPENIGLPWTEFADYLERFPNFMDGSGLNPLLQNYWMTIHPPTLFLGFASTIVPFAYAIGGLLRKDYKGWIKPALPWAFFSVMILGTGILMGGAWAYEALSFGGFWAWDPVENSSLVPWLTMVAGAHLLLVQRNRGGVLPSTFFLNLISFLLVLYSTFLTRSGILGDSSVHAFVDLGLSGQLLIYLLFFVVISLGIFLFHYKKMPKAKTEESFDSREFWLFVGSMVFLLSSLQITISTSMPVFNKLFGPEGLISLYDADKTISKPIEHFNSFQVPFAIILTLLVGLGQYLSYRKTNTKKFYVKISISALLSAIITVVVAMVYAMNNPLYIFLLFTSVFAVIGNLDYWFRVAKGNKSSAGSSIAHIGFGLVILGALISNANKNIISQNRTFIHDEFPANENLLVEENDTLQIGDYWVTYTGERLGEGNVSHYNYYDLKFYKEDENHQLIHQFDLAPSIQKNERMGNVAEPSTRHFLHKDIYTHVTFADMRTPEEKASEWQDEKEFTLNKGDEKEIYRGITVVLDSVMADYRQQEDGTFDFIALAAQLSIRGAADSVIYATPLYMVRNNQASTLDAEMPEFGLKFQLAGVDMSTNQPMIKVWRQREPETPFILIQAIVFPMINILWAGCILMAIGTLIAVWQRLKMNKNRS